MIRRLVSSAALAATALLAVAAPVSAHIDPNPTQARAGSQLTVTMALPSTPDSTTPGAAAPTTNAPEGTDASGNSGTGTIVFIASIACVLGLGAYVVYRSRQARAASPN